MAQTIKQAAIQSIIQYKAFWGITLCFLLLWSILMLMAKAEQHWQQHAAAALEVTIFAGIVIVPSILYKLFYSEQSAITNSAYGAVDSLLKLALTLSLFSLAPIILSTPFPLVSHLLQQFDAIVHFNQKGLMLWLFSHPSLLNALYTIYASTLVVCMIMFFIVGYKKPLTAYRYIVVTQLGMLFTAIIFYFFPSLSPVFFSIKQITALGFPLHITNFLLDSRIDHIEFMRAQTDLNPMMLNYLHVGFIALPSFHTFLALMLFKMTKQCLGKVAILLFVYLIAIIFAVLALGEHYILDLIAAAILFYCCMKLTQRIEKPATIK